MLVIRFVGMYGHHYGDSHVGSLDEALSMVLIGSSRPIYALQATTAYIFDASGEPDTHDIRISLFDGRGNVRKLGLGYANEYSKRELSCSKWEYLLESYRHALGITP